jgi:hypothetical protein
MRQTPSTCTRAAEGQRAVGFRETALQRLFEHHLRVYAWYSFVSRETLETVNFLKMFRHQRAIPDFLVLKAAN